MKKLLRSLFILMVVSLPALAQERTVTGTVTSREDGLPIPGASVKVKEIPSIGIITGSNGRFSLKIPSNGKTLVFSYLGYITKEIAISTNNQVEATLDPDSKILNEVVVTAGGIVRSVKEQGYASTKVTASELTAGKSPTLAGGLTGKVPGLQINAVSSGVNPNYRLVLRGNRSLTGNNQALVVLDNVVVPSEVLGNINPEDVEDITVLNGASGAALYGSDASNGALLVTTKKGKRGGAPVIKVSNTYSVEEVNFFPQIQKKFGSGSTTNAQIYDPIENQQYGPAFDGSTKDAGSVLQDGSIQRIVYSPTNDKYDFWQTGSQNQTDFSISSGDEKSTLYLSGQYVDGKGTTPKDVFNRLSLRLNGSRNISNRLSANYSLAFIENKYNTTYVTSTIYDNLLNTPAQIPLLTYKNWETDKFANPNGYYNDYYENPYWAIDNYRQDQKNAYITGNTEFKFNVIQGLDLTYRAGITKRMYTSKARSRGFTYTDYTLAHSSKDNKASSVSDSEFTTNQFTSDLFGNYKKDIKDFSLNAIVGASIKTTSRKDLDASGNGLQIDGLYNLGNITGNPSASESNIQTRQYGVWADITLGFKKYLYLHLTGRNDWDSRLTKENRSFFYPAADLSFVATDAIPALQNSQWVSYLKLRAGASQVGLININPYATDPTFDSITGYTSGTFYSQSSLLVAKGLKPEITKGFEFGADFRLYKDLIEGTITYYKTKSTDQVITAGVSTTTGFSSYLINAGQLDNKGIETGLHITPIKSSDWKLTVGGNYTYNENTLAALTQDLSRAAVNGSSLVYGVVGQPFPVIIGTDYNRDSQGRVIVNATTGNPSVASGSVILGNTQPKHRLGLDMSVSWKSLTLSSLFEYRGGYIMLNTGDYDFSGSSIRSTYYNRERFVFPNSSYLDPATNTYVANNNVTVSDGGAGFWTSSSYNRNINSNYIYSGNYWKWREVALSYRLPNSILGNVKFIKAATISAQGRNLFLWAPKSNEFTDPDYSANGTNNAIGVANLTTTPPTRYFGGTISLTF